MNFSENDQSCIIIEKLSGMRSAGLFCDIEFLLQGQVFKAHRCVLAASSEYFYTSFRTRKIVKEKVIVKDCRNAGALQSLLNYMYSGAIVINEENVTGLIQLAHQFEMTKVAGYCVLYLRDHINVSNCLSIINVAIEYGRSDLEEIAREFIQQNIGQLLEKTEIFQFSTEKLRLLLKDQQNVSQLDILKLICRWFDGAPKGQRNGFQDLLALINWQNVNSALLEENIDCLSALRNSKQCWNTFLKCLEENNIKLPESQECPLESKQEIEAEEEESNGLDNGDLGNHSDSETEQQIEMLDEPESNAITLEPVKSRRRKAKHPQKYTRNPRRSYNTRSSVQVNEQLDISKSDDNNEGLDGSEEISDEEYSGSSRKRRKSSYKNLNSQNKKGKFDNSIKTAASFNKSFQCPQCNDVFKSSFKLRKHLKNEHVSEDDDNTSEELLKLRKSHGTAKCDQCSYTSHSFHRLKSHIETFHTTDKKYKCVECDFMWSWTGEYTEHLKTHFKRPPFKCKECTYVTRKLIRLANHNFRHSVGNQFSCDVCGEAFKSPVILQRHKKKCRTPGEQAEGELPVKKDNELSSKKKPKKFKCDKCPLAADSLEMLEHHIKGFHKTEETYKCPDCDFNWKNISDYNMHVKSHYDGPPYKCGKCNYSSDKIYYLASHLFVHTKDTKFKCGFCNEFYAAPQVLRAHISRRHPLKTPYACHLCNRSFSMKCLMEAHVQNHSMEKRHLCDICGFSTRFKRNLFAHKLIHNERKFLCDYPGCRYKTIFESILNRHKRTHTGERPYVCSYCGKSYPTVSYLGQHERIHLNVRYTCEECGSTFTMKKGLKRHMNTCHGTGMSSRKASQPRKSRLMRIQDESEGAAQRPSCSKQVMIRNNQADGNYTSRSEDSELYDPDNSPRYFGHMPHQVKAMGYIPAGGNIIVTPHGPTNVPQTIPHDIPTKFQSFMTFF